MYRDDVEALAARHTALESEVAHKTRELEHATRLLDEARAKARLPVLDNIRVASPCSADWLKMSGDERARFCGDCKKNVYNLSEMTREEAEALIIAKEGRLCVRYYQRRDGTIMLADCTVGVANGRKRKLIAAGAVALLAGGGAAAFALRPTTEAANAPDSVIDAVTVQTMEIKGQMVAAEPPPPPVTVKPVEQPEFVHIMGDYDPGDAKMGKLMPFDEDLVPDVERTPIP